MSDDLIKRLLDWSEHDEGKINDARQEAADCIKQLERERDGLVSILSQASAGLRLLQRAEEAEAKLAKAVGGLKRISRQPDFRLPSHQEIARTTLAELEGKDE